ncbi:MAG TPA: glycoside hydrolase family 15 protein [Elusimicrobiota bacterium]|nr:glycoside hydrolase family 15 protein [Elusimicrobiota bacterium]
MKNSAQAPGYKPISEYGVIGDLRTVALVGTDGSIDWCCLPRFDSPSLFAALLDKDKGGHFKISPVGQTINKQMYLSDTAVLLTRFLTPDGVGEIEDFMPLREGAASEDAPHDIVRRVRVVRGAMRFRLDLHPAFDYARARHKLSLTSRGAVFACGRARVGLTSPIKLKAEGQGVSAEFTLKAGKCATFLLRHDEDHASALEKNFDDEKAFCDTVDFWRRWTAGIRYKGRWLEMVRRSAITLKLLTYAPTGAIVAAPTASLPERLGGERNWDYRYTWIRDAAFTVYAFLNLGLTAEAESFMHWIDARAREAGGKGSLQVLYSVTGRHEVPEKILTHLEGYAGSAPVRVGNAAAGQFQLDIYGELMDTVYLANKYGRPISHELWTHLRTLLDYACDNWRKPDDGIWEVRGGRRNFVYSKMMAWVALDRGLRLAGSRGFPGDQLRWLRERDAVYEQVMERGWDEKRKSFVQHYGSNALDAANLLMPMVHFVAPTDPRMLGTLDATLKGLTSDSLVRRYQIGKGADDGLSGGEGSFSMCTFWLAEALCRAGKVSQARLIFEKMLSYANHLGLYSEQTGPCGEALGNFPQAFTHLALITAAYQLDQVLGRD